MSTFVGKVCLWHYGLEDDLDGCVRVVGFRDREIYQRINKHDELMKDYQKIMERTLVSRVYGCEIKPTIYHFM